MSLCAACGEGSNVASNTGGEAGGGGSAANTAGSSGQPGSGGGGSNAGGGASAPAAGTFTLLFRDDFDQIDATRWQLMTHSWDSNLALFSDQTASVADGILSLELLAAPADTVDSTGKPKPFLGAEMRSLDTLTYGRVRSRLKFAQGPAVVSSLVTIYTPWPADDWNELDMECLGKTPATLQLNTNIYLGAPTTPPVTASVTPTQRPVKPALTFDPSADFHEYTIEWTPAAVTFRVDDQLLYSWNEHIDRVKLPQNVLLTIWASASASWAGAVAPETTGATVQYDWVELYRWAP